MSGPLDGLRVVEFEGIGPAPYCGMLLADLGADVVRIARPHVDRGPLIKHTGDAPIDRGRTIVTLDLKNSADHADALSLLEHSDALIEGLRPGVMERLALGPAQVHARAPSLVYCRVTGWGQQGPWAKTAGHDLNYIALSGALAAMGQPGQPPMPPLNLVGDYGGGGLFAAFGLLAGVMHARSTGRGQVIDSAMVDGASSQMTMMFGLLAKGSWSLERGQNFLDGAAPFYRCYACSDGKYLSVAAIEPQFFAAFMAGIGLEATTWDQTDRVSWPAMAEEIANTLRKKPRCEWEKIFDGTDACVAPVLSMAEAPSHPHNAAREAFIPDPAQPAPGPRFSQTPGMARGSARMTAAEALVRWNSR